MLPRRWLICPMTFRFDLAALCMSWLYSQALVAEYSADTCSDGEPSALSSSIATPPAYCWPAKTMAPFRLFRFGMMCAPLTDTLGADILTSFLAAFHVPTFQSPEKAPELPASIQDYGGKWRASLARFDRDSCSLKTVQLSLLGDWTESSPILPRCGSMRNGCVYPQPTSAPPHIRDRIWILAHSGEHRCWVRQNEHQPGKFSAPAADACFDGTTQFMADTNHAKQCTNSGTGRGTWQTPTRDDSRRRGPSVSDPDGPGLEKRHDVSRTGGASCAEVIRQTSFRIHWWKTEPPVGRVANGVANRVDRLRALGNGQVPIVAATAWRLLYERMTHE